MKELLCTLMYGTGYFTVGGIVAAVIIAWLDKHTDVDLDPGFERNVGAPILFGGFWPVAAVVALTCGVCFCCLRAFKLFHRRKQALEEKSENNPPEV